MGNSQLLGRHIKYFCPKHVITNKLIGAEVEEGSEWMEDHQIINVKTLFLATTN